jgi:hypothetical protein
MSACGDALIAAQVRHPAAGMDGAGWPVEGGMVVVEYRLVYAGDCPPGESPEAAKSRLRALFRGDPAAFEAAYANLPLTIARGMERTRALAWQAALARRGIPCRIVAAPPDPPGKSVAGDPHEPPPTPGVSMSGAPPAPAAPGRFPGSLPGLMAMMLTHPRGAIRIVLQRASVRTTWVLAALAGVSQAIPRAMSPGSAAGDLPMAVMVPVVVGGAALLGLGWLFLQGALLTWTGRWLGGRARSGAIRAAVAWAEVPGLLGMLLWVPRYLMLGPRLFARPDALAGQNLPLALAGAGFGVLQTALEVWALVLLVHALAEVQEFSAARALGNLILSVVLPAAPLGLLALWLL